MSNLRISIENVAGHVEIELPIYARSEPNLRQHWSKKSPRAKEQRGVTSFALGVWRPTMRTLLEGGPVRITLTRIRPSRRKALDDDNLRGSLKAVRDGVADAMGMKDDSDPRLTWDYEQEARPGKEYAVRIRVASKGR